MSVHDDDDGGEVVKSTSHTMTTTRHYVRTCLFLFAVLRVTLYELKPAKAGEEFEVVEPAAAAAAGKKMATTFFRSSHQPPDPNKSKGGNDDLQQPHSTPIRHEITQSNICNHNKTGNTSSNRIPLWPGAGLDIFSMAGAQQ